MKVKVYLATTAAPKIAKSLYELPAHIRPTRLSADERGKDDNQQLRLDSLEEYCAANPAGFMLHAQDCLYEIKVHQWAGSSTLLAFAKDKVDEQDCLAMLRIGLALGATFGFTCTEEELDRRNRIALQIGVNKIEAWVGRDPTKHSPGIYWRTLLSQNSVEAYNLDLKTLPDGMAVERWGDQYVLLSLPGRASDWESNTELVESYCERTEGIFSIRSARRELMTARDLATFDQLHEKWS